MAAAVVVVGGRYLEGMDAAVVVVVVDRYLEEMDAAVVVVVVGRYLEEKDAAVRVQTNFLVVLPALILLLVMAAVAYAVGDEESYCEMDTAVWILINHLDSVTVIAIDAGDLH